jgi:hypothetical protein
MARWSDFVIRERSAEKGLTMRSTTAVLAISLVMTASAASGTQYTCAASVAVQPTVRSEGLGELIGDLILLCSGTVPENGISDNLTVSLGTNVTSKLIAAASEALLLVDDPPPGSQTLGTNVFEGTVAANQVTFTNVPLGPAPGGENVQHVIRIVNVRINAEALSNSTNAVPVLAAISVSGSTSVPVNDPVQTVAFIQPGSTFSANCIGGSVELRFTELFPTAYKTRGTQMQNVPGNIYTTESGFTPDPTLPGNPGFADTGTELGVALSGIAAGVVLSVPPTITADTLVLDAVSPPGGGVVPIVGGEATIVYEVVASTPLADEAVIIPLQVSSVQQRPPAIVVRGTLYPISDVVTASTTAPIPRFADESVALEVPLFCTGAPAMSSLSLMVMVVGLLGGGVMMARRRSRS